MGFWRIVQLLTLPLLVLTFWHVFKAAADDRDEPLHPEDFKKAIAGILIAFLVVVYIELDSEPVVGIIFNLICLPLWFAYLSFSTMYGNLDAVRRYRESQKPPPPPPPTVVSHAPKIVERIIRHQLNAGRVIPDHFKDRITTAIQEIEQADFTAQQSMPPPTEATVALQNEHYLEALPKVFDAYFEHFPRTTDYTMFEAPITSVVPVGEVVSAILRATIWNRKCGCFDGIYKTMNDHCWGVSRRFLSEKEIAAKRFIFPNTYPGNPSEIPNAYLRDTPFERLFAYERVAVPVNPRLRLEHQFILAPSGTGKTQLLQAMIARDIEKVVAGEASIIVIDSQGVQRRKPDSPTLVGNIIHLKALKDKLTYIKPSKSLAMNIFEAGQNDPTLTQEQRDIRLRSVREMVAMSLGGATDLQFQMLKWCMRLALLADQPNIHVLRDIMTTKEEVFPTRFRAELKRADDTTKRYFSSFFDGARNSTKQSLTTRIDGFIEDDASRAMLDHPGNDVQLIDQIEASRVIVVDADKAILGKFGTEAFGRFFLAQILFAARQRQSTKPVYVYIDECHDFISNDENISELLVQARKQDIGLILATQNMVNIQSAKVRENLHDVAILVGHDEAKPAGVFNLKLRGRANPIEVTVRAHVMENMERMTPEEFEQVHRPKPPPSPPAPPTTPPQDDDVV